ncbi:hypothetical protein L2D14_02300 [Thalassospiraceae bacterium LMO-JJ14]|nr:hypothetical protein L2D14_02300 [Thalassospiraceae bacterium LMO-JJ14]
MNIRKIAAASAIALTLGFGASAQASNIDHLTADINPAVFGASGTVFSGTVFASAQPVMNVDHITEATKPHVFGASQDAIMAEKTNTEFTLPYERG